MSKQAKLAKRKDNYQKRKASDTDEQTQAKLAKRKDNYQKRKASETDKQRQAKLAKRRDSYQRKKDSNNMQTITVQAPCSSSELDCISSTNTTDKNQYLREFDARKNGEIHMQDWAKPGAIIRDGDRKRGVHASPCVVPKKLFLEKIAPPFTS